MPLRISAGKSLVDAIEQAIRSCLACATTQDGWGIGTQDGRVQTYRMAQDVVSFYT